MQARQQYIDAYHAATAKEADLWIKVQGKGPGMPGFDRNLWKTWLDAVSATTAASKALREAFTGDSKPSDLA
jgi:hypothetical protein